MKKNKISESVKKEVGNLANQFEKKLGKISTPPPTSDQADSNEGSRFVPHGGYAPPPQYVWEYHHQPYQHHQPPQPPVAHPPYMQQQQVPQPYLFTPQHYQHNMYAPPLSPQMAFVPQTLPLQQNQSPHIYQQQQPLHNLQHNQHNQSASSQSNNKMSTPPTLPPNHANGMANAGYENASTPVKAETGMHKYIIKTSTVATLKSCRVLGVQPWFCSLRELSSGGGVSEEYHSDLKSLLTANFKSISMPVTSAADLQLEFENRNRQIFSGYSCEIRHQHPTSYTPAVLIETFGNYHEMLQVYYSQSLRYMNAVKSQANRHVEHPRRDDFGGCTSLKFAIINKSGGKINR